MIGLTKRILSSGQEVFKFGNREIGFVEDKTKGCITAESQEISKLNLEKDKFVLSVNRYPAYTTASSLDVPIHTSGLMQCAALILVNKKLNWHYLAHVGRGAKSPELLNHLKQLQLNKQDLKDMDFYILPGSYLETKFTVKETMEALEKLKTRLSEKVQFLNFSSDSETIPWLRGVVSYEGKVFELKNRPIVIEKSKPMIDGGQTYQVF